MLVQHLVDLGETVLVQHLVDLGETVLVQYSVDLGETVCAILIGPQVLCHSM